MAQKKYFKYFTLILLATISGPGWHAFLGAEDTKLPDLRSVELQSSDDFTFVGQPSTIFTIRPLKSELRSIETLKNLEAIGVVYLGNILLEENATPLSALRDLSVQISSGLDMDLALITDSTTSQSLEPHELLLLYHPQLVMTLALTKSVDNEEYSLIGTYSVPDANTPESVTQPIEESE